MIRRIHAEFDTGDDAHDLKARDYSLLERKHKQDGATFDQIDHFEAGWEAAIRYVRELVKRP